MEPEVQGTEISHIVAGDFWFGLPRNGDGCGGQAEEKKYAAEKYFTQEHGRSLLSRKQVDVLWTRNYSARLIVPG
jgi:hypothetical protein